MINPRTSPWVIFTALLAMLIFAWLTGAFDFLSRNSELPPQINPEGGSGVGLIIHPEEALSAERSSDSDSTSSHATLKATGKAKPVLTFHVVDRRGERLVGVPVELSKGEKKNFAKHVKAGRTDASGTARFPGVHLSDVDWVRVLDSGRQGDHSNIGNWVDEIKVEGHEMTLVSDKGIPISVVFFDWVTGEIRSDVSWDSDQAISTTRAGKIARVNPGEFLRFYFTVNLPVGSVAWKRRLAMVQVAKSAKSLVLHYPLHREQVVELRVLKPDGTPYRGDLAANVDVDDTDVHDTTWTFGESRGHVSQGVPWLGGREISVEWVCESGRGAWSGALPATFGASLRATVKMVEINPNEAPLEGPETNGSIRIDGGSSVADQSVEPKPKPKGGLRVRCVLGDGRPVEGVTVTGWGRHGKEVRRYPLSGKTNARGVVSWDELTTGEWQISFLAWFRTRGRVQVVEGKTTGVELRELEGGRADIEVVDQSGDPVPFADLSARHIDNENAWRPVPDTQGVQRVDSYTDHLGRRTLRRLYPGEHKFVASDRYIEAHANAVVIDREAIRVEVVIPVTGR